MLWEVNKWLRLMTGEKTYSWQGVYELSKGAQCQLGCNNIMFTTHMQESRVNPGLAFINELSQRSCVDGRVSDRAITIISLTAVRINNGSDPCLGEVSGCLLDLNLFIQPA